MERIWLPSYPAGIPADIDYRQYRSVGELFDEGVAKYASRTAYHHMGRDLSFAELDRAARAFGAWLQARGLSKGARVALMMPNVLQYPIGIFGALRAGYVVVNTNPLYTPRELEYQLIDSGAEAIVILENFAHTLAQVIHRTPVRHVVIASMGDMLGLKGPLVNLVVRRVKKMVPPYELPGAVRWNDMLREGERMTLAPVEVGPEDIAFLQYTGGTTGVAKGAMLLHRNIIANVLQAEAWVRPFMSPDRSEIVITALPLYHIFSLTVNCLLFFKAGGCGVLITNPRDIPALVKEMGRHRFTVFGGVNTLFNALLHNPDFAKLDFSALRISLGGGMAVQKQVAEKWKEVTGCTLVEAYGLTETSPGVTVNPLDIPQWNGTIGVPLPSTDVEIRDDEGRPVPLGQAGEICIRGPQVMAGYWNKPEETAKVMHPDGFFASGDIGIMDERGFVHIVDRKKDMIVVSGFKVFPNEVEAECAQHPGVLECAAVGVPDEHSGEVVKLYVVRKDPKLTEEALKNYLHDVLTGYKRPHYIEFRDQLPKTNVGKILRRALREEALRAAAPARENA
ncbi:MAG: long-chain-fatty-acid--CoA ligase [Pseudomonadota bacterium]|nr:MAG: long-chain-fatty-acid--CoA ligase [Pseudomonadota bacterium]